MKKLSLIVAAAGLMALGACSDKKSPESNAVLEDGANGAAALVNAADNLSEVAENVTNSQIAGDLNNAASNADAAADNVSDMAQNLAADVDNKAAGNSH